MKKKRLTTIQLIQQATDEHDAILLKFIHDKWSVTLRMSNGDWWYWSDETLRDALYGALYEPTAEQPNFEGMSSPPFYVFDKTEQDDGQREC
jgi:hypothetical protein